MIKFSDIRSMGLKAYSNYVRDNLDRKLFFEFNSHHLVYHCLKLTNFRKVSNSKESVSSYSHKVLRELLYPKLNSVLDFDPLIAYMRVVLNLRVLPIIEKAKLEIGVKKDLATIENLLKKYNEDEFIKKFKENQRRPGNHLERTKHDFYQRTLRKREIILDYLVNKIEDRAILNSETKSKYGPLGDDDELMKEMKDHSDYPYRDLIISLKGKGWTYGLDLEQLDWEEINPYRNKANVFAFKSDISNPIVRNLDRAVLRDVDGVKRLRFLQKEVRQLPLSDRDKIFKELRRLYDQKLWYGFYALALPQIEGIFSEMVKACLPYAGQKSSLSDKVNAVRPFVEHSSYSFDYYEYYLPFQRNKFSHSGNDDDIQLKCKYLVLDLEDVVQNFKELESPIVQINNMVNESVSRFKHIGNFSHFLYLFFRVKEIRQLSLIREKVDRFVYSVLLKQIDFEIFFKNLQVDFDLAIKESESLMKYVLRTYLEKELDFYKITKKELHDNIDGIVKTIQEHGILLLENIKLLLDTQNFVMNFPKVFPKISEETIKSFQDFVDKNSDALERLQILNSKRQITSDEDFIIRRDWLHTLNH